MRVHLLLALGLSSCSLLVRGIDPCVGNTPNSDKLCFFQSTAVTSGQVVQAKSADIDGDGLPDLVMRTNNSGSHQIEALLSTNDFALTNISLDAGITDNILYFDLANMDESPAPNDPVHIVMLTNLEAITLSQPNGLDSRISIRGTQNEILFGGPFGEIRINTSAPAAIITGDFIPEANQLAGAEGREIAIAYANSDAALVGPVTPNVTNIVFFAVGSDDDDFPRFATEDILSVASILEMGSHNVDGTANNSAEELFLIVQNTNNEVEGVFFRNDGILPPRAPNRETLAGQLGAAQIVNFNNDPILDLLVADASDNSLHSLVIQIVGDEQPSIDETNSTSILLSGPSSAVGLVRLGDKGQHIMIAEEGTIEIIQRAPNGALTLLPETVSIDTPISFLFGFDADATTKDKLVISTENNDLFSFTPQ